MIKQYPLKLTYLIQDQLLSLPLKISKTLQTHKVLFHKNVSQPPSQRYDFENNNGRNSGNEVETSNVFVESSTKKTASLRNDIFLLLLFWMPEKSYGN